MNKMMAQNCCKLLARDKQNIKALSKRYKQLRYLSSNDCCQNFGSGLMDVMQLLGDSISDGTPRKQIIELMSMPDIIVDTEHPLEHHFINLFPSEKVFIYY